MIRRVLLLAWIALLLVGGAGIDVAEGCATARACCCKAAVATKRIEIRRTCGCGCRVEPKAPAPERPATNVETVRDPALRPGGDLVAIGPVATQLVGADLATPARPSTGPPRFVLYCVWRI